MLVYLLALGAALLFGLGSVVQQRVASVAPPGKNLRFGLLLWLVRQPAWLAGVGTAVVGNLLSGAALGKGSVALVQPLLVSRLVFALPLSAAWARQRFTGRDWLGIVATAGGLATFIAVGRPTASPHTQIPLWHWLVVVAAMGSITATLVLFARRQAPRREAPMLGAGAGMLFALQSGLTHVTAKGFIDHGVGALFLNWTTYAVAGAAVTGTLLAQSAYEMAPLASSYPTLAAVEPLAGIGLGAGVLGSTLVLTPVSIAGFLLGLVVMTGGIYLLATSGLVTGRAEEMEMRRLEEQSADLGRAVQDELRELEEAVAWLENARQHSKPVQPEKIDAHLRQVDTLLSRATEAMGRLSVLDHEAQQRAAAPGQQSGDRQRQLQQRYLAVQQEREQELRAKADELQQRAQATGCSTNIRGSRPPVRDR